MVEYRSVSQVKELLPEFDGCGYRYYLKRIARDDQGNRLWQRPAAWFTQGLAVHETVEAVERSGRTMALAEAQDVYTKAYDVHTNRQCEDTPRFDYWFRSGPYAGKADVERRYGIGKEQVGKYFAYIETYPDDIPDVLDGELAVELPFDVEFGDVRVRGVIDQVVKKKPIDVKTGNRAGDPFQLGTYSGALKRMYDIEPSTGAFWMGKSGKLTVQYDLSDWTYDRLTDVFGRADEDIRAERFEPDPEPSKCMFCSVAADCSFAA